MQLREILFIQGGAEGAHVADGKLVASLRRALGDSFEILYPQMPDESDPDYSKWKPVIESELASTEGVATVIGHSLGGSFLLKFLVEEKTAVRIAGVFLIAAPYWGGEGWVYEGYERVMLPEDFASRLPAGASVFLYHSRNDETVPFEHMALYSKRLPQARTRPLDRGHQLNDDLSEVAADIQSLDSDAAMHAVFRNVPSYDANVSINGRHSVWMSRIIRPFGRFVFAWLEWRARRRARNESGPA